MKQAKLILDKYFITGQVDKRLFGSFLEHMGRAVYEGVYQPGLPVSDSQGFRQDVLEMIRELNVPIVRYPGGNFLSAYRWEDSVGPKSERPTRADVAWKSIESNQFGLNEFMDWCELANTEPMMAVNLGTRGIDAARNVLEYCNFKGGTYYSDLRRSHGWEKPHNVKVWCLGNEMDGPWQIGQKKAWEYGHIASQAARLMRVVDPSIELVACGSSTASMGTFGEWEMGVLEECYDDVDYISMHAYYGKFTEDTGDLLAASVEMDQFIDDCVAVCDAMGAKKHNRKRINISFDEWNVNYHYRMSKSEPGEWKNWYLTTKTFEEFYYKHREKLPKNPPYDWEVAAHRCEDIYTVEDALAVGGLLISLMRHADRVKIACQAQLVNVIAPIMTSDTGAFKQTIFYPYLHASLYGRGQVLQTMVQSPSYESQVYGAVPTIDSVAVMQPDERSMALFILNRDSEATALEADLRQMEGWQVKKHLMLHEDNLLLTNDFTAPNRVVPHEVSGRAVMENGKLTVNLEAYSWNVVIVGEPEHE